MSSILQRQIRKVHSRMSDVDKWYDRSDEAQTRTKTGILLLLPLLLALLLDLLKKMTNSKQTNSRDCRINDITNRPVLMLTMTLHQEKASEIRFPTGR